LIRKPFPDLNGPPEPKPEPAPPAPLSADEEEDLQTKRERELRVLLQIGYQKRGRNENSILQLLQEIDIDSEKDVRFLDELSDHLSNLSRQQGGTAGQPEKLSKEGLAELLRWISNKKGKTEGGGGILRLIKGKARVPK